MTGLSFAAARPLLADRREGGRRLAAELAGERGPGLVVLGLARGGVVVAAEVARILGAPLDVLAVRKVCHPRAPEYALGAVTPRGGVYLRGDDGLTGRELAEAVAAARAEAARLDDVLHRAQPGLDVAARNVLLVDDGFATGATMVAAARSVRASGAARVVAAAPVGAAPAAELLLREVDSVVCPHRLEPLRAVGCRYESFDQVDDADVVDLVRRSRQGARRGR